jgi:exodeoxyribonuclease VII large subunit
MSVDRILRERKMRLSGMVGRLEATNPLAVLGRGYSIATDERGAVVSSTVSVTEGDRISVRVSDGIIDASVCATRER